MEDALSVNQRGSNDVTVLSSEDEDKQVLMFYHLKTRRCVNTVLM